MQSFEEREPEDAIGAEVKDAVPAEWTAMIERRYAEREADLAKQRRSMAVAAAAVGIFLAVGALIALTVVIKTNEHPASDAQPSEVQSFAESLPASQQPNASGATVLDGRDAPDTWRVAWVTDDNAFCFAFVHSYEAAQTQCEAPGSVTTAKVAIAGELTDTGMAEPALFVCGYTTSLGTGGADVSVDDDAVVGETTDMSSALSGFCIQLPEGVTAGQSITVSTYEVTNVNGKSITGKDVTLTYP